MTASEQPLPLDDAQARLKAGLSVALEAWSRGEYQAVARVLRDLLPSCREHRCLDLVATASAKLACASAMAGQLDEARSFVAAGLESVAELGDPALILDLTESAAYVHLKCGNPRRATILVGTARQLRDELELVRPSVDEPLHLGLVSGLQAELGPSYARWIESVRGLDLTQALALIPID